MAEDSYFVRWRGQISGPFNLETLRRQVETNQLTKLHEVSQSGGKWQQASRIPGLFQEYRHILVERKVEPAPLPPDGRVAAVPPEAFAESASFAAESGPESVQPGAALRLAWSIVIAVSFLALYLFAAIKHGGNGVVTTAAVGFAGGLAALLSGWVLVGRVRDWARAGIGILIIILLVALSSMPFAPQSDTQFVLGSVVPIELFVLYGYGYFIGACVFLLMVVSLAFAATRRRIPASTPVRYLLGSAAGFASAIYLGLVLSWVAQTSNPQSLFFLFRSGDAVLIVYLALALAGVVALLAMELATAFGSTQASIKFFGRACVVIAWCLFWLAAGANVFQFLLKLGNEVPSANVQLFVLGLSAEFATLWAAASLAVCGIRDALEG